MASAQFPFIRKSAFFAWVLLCFAFTLSPALISIGFILLALCGLLMLPLSGFSKAEKQIALLFLLFYSGTAVSAAYSQDGAEAIRKLILKLPLLFFPLVLNALHQSHEKYKIRMVQVLLFALYLPASVSVYNYYLNRALFDQLILESKPLPIEFGYGIYHIQFSVLLAASILLGVYLLLRKRTEMSAIDRWLAILLTGLNFFFLHILSARTGLLSMYTGLLALGLSELKRLPLRLRRISLLLALALPLAFLMFSSSLQNRLKNTADDLRVVWQGTDANDYSFAMRVQAWKNAWQVIAEHPLNGVGVGDAGQVLYEHFAVSNPSITPSNRRNPHLQFLETAVQSGLLTALIFLLIILRTAFLSLRGDALPAAMALLLFSASCFESILERQASVVGFSILLAMAISLSSGRK